MVKLGTVSRMSSFTVFKFCFLNLLSDPFGLPRPFGVVIGVFVDRVSAVTNSALIVFFLSDPLGLPRPLGVIWGLPRLWFTTVGFGSSSSCGIVALLSAYRDLKLQLHQNEKFQGTEVGALFLLISGVRMRILLSLPTKNKAPASVVTIKYIEIINSLTIHWNWFHWQKLSEFISLTKMALCQGWWIPSAFRSRDKNEQKSHWIDDETRVLDFIKCDSNKKLFLFFFS